MIGVGKRAARLAKKHKRAIYVHANPHSTLLRDAFTFEFSESATIYPMWKAEPDGTVTYLGWDGPTPSAEWAKPRPAVGVGGTNEAKL